jgi:hypothetical protein
MKIVHAIQHTSDNQAGVLTLAANEVDIWQIDLAGKSDGIQQSRCLLSPDEIHRAGRRLLIRSVLNQLTLDLLQKSV